MFDSLERQVTLLEKYVADLQLKEAELAALRADMAEHPLSESDLQHRYDQLVEIFDSMKDTLSCAVCYEPYGRDEAVSLMCGHTFCQSVRLFHFCISLGRSGLTPLSRAVLLTLGGALDRCLQALPGTRPLPRT